jgi:hypothetical protein
MGMRSTQVILKRIIRLVIETGTVTGTHTYLLCDITNEKIIALAAAIAIIKIVLTVLPNHPSYFTTPSEVLAKVYSNSMMVVLNSRMRIGTDENLEITTLRITHLRSDNPTRGEEAFELGESVLVRREEIVFPRDPDEMGGNGYQTNKSSYVV